MRANQRIARPNFLMTSIISARRDCPTIALKITAARPARSQRRRGRRPDPALQRRCRTSAIAQQHAPHRRVVAHPQCHDLQVCPCCVRHWQFAARAVVRLAAGPAVLGAARARWPPPYALRRERAGLLTARAEPVAFAGALAGAFARRCADSFAGEAIAARSLSRSFISARFVFTASR